MSAKYIVTNRFAPVDVPLELLDMGPWDRFQTITNAAEEVVAELVAAGLLPPGRRCFYLDSRGDRDELLVRDGVFAGFAPGPQRGL